MDVITDASRMDGHDGTRYTGLVFNPIDIAAAQALTESDENGFHVGNAERTAAAVVALCRRPIIVEKPVESVDISPLHFSSDHLNEPFLKETAQQRSSLVAISGPFEGLTSTDVRYDRDTPPLFSGAPSSKELLLLTND